MADGLLKKYELVSGQPGPRVLIVAGVHGDEYEPMLAAHEIIEDLNGKLSHGSIIIVPVANEDAYKQQNRCGTDGLDLARICPGDASGTATHRTAFELSELIRQADYMIDMHTGGLTYDIFPMAGYMLVDDPELLEKQQDLAIATGLPLIWGTDAKPNGRTLSVARDCAVPALYFEYGGGTGFRSKVVKTYKQAVEGVLVKLGILSTDHKPTDDWVVWLEDYRTNSGYLQDKMPSPGDGVFVAEVSTGDWVIAGQRFGYILDPIQNHKYDIYVKNPGLVFLLRTMIDVKKGDALGGIMEAKNQEKRIIHGE